MPATKHKKSRIGLTKDLKIKADGTTITSFRVYGDSIGAKNPNTAGNPDHKHVKTKSTHYNLTITSWGDVGDDSVEIKVTAVHKLAKRVFGTDDLTVTIVLDELTPDPDTAECVFDDVEFIP